MVVTKCWKKGCQTEDEQIAEEAVDYIGKRKMLSNQSEK